MRLLRLLALAAVLAAVYFAQYIFDHLSLAEFFPDRLLRAIPVLARYTRWLANDLLLLALVLAVLAALLFGLLAPPWRGRFDVDRRVSAGRSATGTAGPSLIILLLSLSVAGAGAVALLLWLTGRETTIVLVIWWISTGLFLAGLILADRENAPLQARIRRPAGGAVVVALLAALLGGWQLASLPSQLDPGLAAFSVEALRGTEGAHMFLPTSQGLPRLATWPSAAFMQIGRNVLVEMRLPGLLAAVTTAIATWLVGRVLFRRRPVYAPGDEVIEDDGSWMALVAGILVAITIAFMHFARLPLYLEPVAWGMLGFWLWCGGLPRGSLTWLGLSGLFAGLALAFGPAGLVFSLTLLLWWLAVFLFDPRWLSSRMRWSRFGAWCAGLWLFLGPLLGVALNAPSRVTAYLRAPALMDAIIFAPDAAIFGLNLRRTLFAFNYTADTSSVFGYPDHLLHSVVAPLLILALGALLLNSDTWLGWMLLAWFTIGIFVAAWLGPRAPFAPVMLPLLPAAALAVAFALDRMRVTLLQSAGPWLEQTTLIFVTGLLIWVGVNSWLGYYPFAARAGDAVSEVARVAHASPGATALLLVNDDVGVPLDWRDPPLLLVQSDLPDDQSREVVEPPAWPATVPPRARILLQPEQRPLLDELTQRYPGGAISVRRDLAGNPVVYMYDLP